MTVESLHIDCFGCLRDFSCTLGPSLNIIEGDNEAGKSTLAAFIRYMLYGFGRAGGSELSEKKKRINWETGRVGGSMIVRVGKNRYRIERSTVSTGHTRGKENYRDSGTIIDLTTMIPSWSEGTPPGERFLGVPEQVFLSTAFVRQVDTRVGGDELNEAIENLLFSGDENLNVQRALDKLDKLRRTLLHKNGKDGDLARLTVREAEYSARMEQAERDRRAIFEEENQLATLKRQLATAEKLEEDAALHEDQENAVRILDSYRRLHEVEGEIAKLEADLKSMDGLPVYRLHESDLTDLALAARAAEEAKTRYKEAKETRLGYSGTGLGKEMEDHLEKAAEDGGTATIRGRAAGADKARLLALIGTGAGTFLSILLFILAFAVPSAFGGFLALPYTLAALLLAAAGGAGFYAYRAHRALLSLFARYGVHTQAEFLLRAEEIDRAGEQVKAYRGAAKDAYETENKQLAAYRRAITELDTVVGRFGTRLPEEGASDFLRTLAENTRRAMEKKAGHEAKIHALQERAEEIARPLAGKSEAEARACLPPDHGMRVEDTHPEEWHKKREFYAANVRQLSLQVGELDRRVSALNARAENPAELQAKRESLRAQLCAARGQYDACIMAYEAISGAGERLRAEISPRLSDSACRMMATLTDGRYSRVGVDNDLSVTVGAGDGTYSLDYLSAGTQDLSYLSLRMALIDLLYKEKPPVFFDESFAHQDNDRTERILRALAEQAENGRQSLIFTCHTRESEMARRIAPDACVIRMAGPA